MRRWARLTVRVWTLFLTPGRCIVMSFSTANNTSLLVDYTPPAWAHCLKHIPRKKVQLGHLNTPIHPWPLPRIPTEFTINIKRDDMTGSTLSGNKVRKLEFLMADALQKECKHVITCGSIHSNHARATAIAATQLGLKAHLILRTDITDKDKLGSTDNFMLDRLCCSSMFMVPRVQPYLTHLKPRMEKLATHLKKTLKEDSYLIPIGGSNHIGLFGYISAFEELISQSLFDDYDDIVFACGSGGTASGISIANYLTGSKIKCHAIWVTDATPYFVDHVQNTLDEVGLSHVKAGDIVDFIDGYKGKGYGFSTQEELDFMVDVSRSTGIMLDPVYTGKAARGLVEELRLNPSRFQGNRILFIHTGGVFGMFDGSLSDTLLSHKRDQTCMWPDVNTDVPSMVL